MVSRKEKDFFVHDTSIVDDGVVIGEGTKIWHYSHLLSGTIMGKNCIVGQNVSIGPQVTVGDGCKIQNNVSVYKGVTLEDKVFCGPSCVFTNVYTPRAFVERKDEFLPTLVRYGATIGANATVICGVTIGRFALIGAGAVVKDDVSDYAVVAGVPARQIGWVCKCGEKLASSDQRGVKKCRRCQSEYKIEADSIEVLKENI
jgi:UDP-2-acetamido-3-amino-2,3-dideoxy-glucuronate N-acetyltransferase